MGKSSSQNVKTSSGIQPASYPKGTKGYFLGVKRLVFEGYHPLPSSVDVKNEWGYTSIPVCFHGVRRDNFTFIHVYSWAGIATGYGPDGPGIEPRWG
jgi:hypothetical protein